MYCKYTWDDYDNTTAIVNYNGSKKCFRWFSVCSRSQFIKGIHYDVYSLNSVQYT